MRSVAFRVSGLIGAGALAVALSGGAAATTEAPTAGSSQIVNTALSATGTQFAIGASGAAFDTFLDRLMRAESNGRSDAKNPLSSALGPFQFIKSTFLDVMRRHFTADVTHLNERDILALRTDHGFARRAAEAFSKENMDYLADRGLKPTFGHLRLAFLLGPVGAARVLEAPPSKPLHQILDDSVIAANPFMRGKSAGDLIARATRDVSPREAPAAPSTVTAEAAPVAQPDTGIAAAPSAEPEVATPPAQPARVAVAEPTPQPAAPSEPRADSAAKPRPAPRAAAARADHGTVRSNGRVAVINVTCNSKLASCRRWIDQQVAKLAKVAAVSTGRGA